MRYRLDQRVTDRAVNQDKEPMKHSDKEKRQLRQLRAEAEAKLATVTTTEPAARPAEELLHELQVHQIELQMQNEALQEALIALEESRDRFVDFYEFAPVGYLTVTETGRIVDVNLTCELLLGADRTTLLRRNFASIVSPKHADRWRLHLAAAQQQEDKLKCELTLRRGNGTDVEVRLDSLRFVKAGQASTVRIVLTDITDRKRAEVALRAQEDFFHLIAENIGDFIAVLDLEGRRLYNSPSYRQFFGDGRDLRGSDSFVEIHPEDKDRVKRIFRETVRTGVGHQIEYRFVKPDGSIRNMESRGDVIRDGTGRVVRVVVVSRDITERKLMEEQVRHLAFYDSLTKLPNRRLLGDRLNLAMAASKRTACYGALMFLDLDNFKPLNDEHGHAVGDLLLMETAVRVKSCIREMDTVARFGGDEFVVMLSSLSPDKGESIALAEAIAGKIRSRLSEPYLMTIKHDRQPDVLVEHQSTASIGVALFLDHEASAEEILTLADKAMYQAKESGRNAIRFYDSNTGACARQAGPG